MYKVTRLVHLTDPTDEMVSTSTLRRISAATAASSAISTVVEPTLPEVRNGGDILVHLQFESAPAWAAARATIDQAMSSPAIDHIDAVEYVGPVVEGASGRRCAVRPATIYRTLLLRVDDDASPADRQRFEHATLQMPAHISAIQAWQLSPVIHREGRVRWTHVWEQEFADLDGLIGDYMFHPVHWGFVDRFFDPESPDQLIRDRVCHSFCGISAPVIGTPAVTAAGGAIL